MQKKLLAVAVAGVLAAPSAFAQTSVTISGTVNEWYEHAQAKGATTPDTAAGTTQNALGRDRLSDGAGSNIRFTVVEDLGAGMQAFVQVESAVISNSDTRANSVGTAAASTSGWGNRNSGIGLRSSAWGEFLMGVWDLHYNEHAGVDSSSSKGASNVNSLGLMESMGTRGNAAGINATFGTRYSNVLRYSSPNWSGFSFRLAYARPSDGVPSGTGGAPNRDKKNRLWNFAPSYSAGPLNVFYSHFRDKDITVSAQPAVWGGAFGTTTDTLDLRSDRLGAAYAFPFGLKIGLMYDRARMKNNTTSALAPTNSFDIKRDVWVFPISYTAGAHGLHFNYARARDWKGNLGAADVGAAANNVVVGGSTYSPGGDTGARMISLSYQYDLSKRTNIHLNYANIRNEALAGYDFFSAPVGIVAGTGFGSDPRVYSIGLRHAF